MSRIWTGDYSTADFRQYDQVANCQYWGASETYPRGQYPARIVALDGDCGYGARFEVRHGDVASGGTERSEAFGGEDCDGAVGNVYWYAWSVKFDASFPLDAPDATGPSGPDAGWAVLTQWQSEPGGMGPCVGFGWPGLGHPNFPESSYGKFYLQQNGSTGAPDYDPYSLTPVCAFDIDPGVWHDFKLQMLVDATPSDEEWVGGYPHAGMSSVGWIKLWHNNIPQTLWGDSTTYSCQTVAVDCTAVRVQQGLYWGSACSALGTGIVSYTGMRMADSEDGL